MIADTLPQLDDLTVEYLPDEIVEAFFNRYPNMKRTWELCGCPRCRLSLVPNQLESTLTLTGRLSREFISHGLLTPRDLFSGEEGAFNKQRLKELAKIQLRGGWLDYHKEIGIATTGKVSMGNHCIASNAEADVPLKARMRWGTDHEESVDGNQLGWKDAEKARLPQLEYEIAKLAFRIHFSRSQPPESEVTCWLDEHREAIKVVMDHLPREQNGDLRVGFRQASPKLAFVEAWQRTRNTPAERERVMDFLVKMRDKEWKALYWLESLETWLRKKAATNYHDRKNIYGAVVCAIKNHINRVVEGVIRKDARWESKQRKEPKFEVESDLTLRKQVSKATGLNGNYAACVASYLTFKSETANVLVEDSLKFLFEVGKNPLMQAVNRSRRIQKKLQPFSSKAVLAFVVENITNLGDYCTGLSLQVAVEDWHLICFKEPRLSMSKAEQYVFDFEWLNEQFRLYKDRKDAYAPQNGM
jgi:hypothetical protein